MPGPYLIGQNVRLSCAFSLASKQPADPTTVALQLATPGGQTQAVATTRDAVGKYHADYVPTTPGQHTYRFSGTGACIAADERVFVVKPSRFA
jgi:hypothetical protein